MDDNDQLDAIRQDLHDVRTALYILVVIVVVQIMAGVILAAAFAGD